MSSILCCIFNYNDNANASAWADRLSPYFDTVILDSGSNPRCTHPLSIPLDNLFYSGLMNEAYRRGKEGNYSWVMIVTSDLQISANNTAKLIRAMREVAVTKNVGLYQPSTAWKGRSLPQSRCHFTGKMRHANFQEGWFHMIRIDLMGKVCPIDVNINRLGWGIDLALSHFARVEKLLVIVDDRIRVVHPGGTGYNRDKAEAQMRAWHATIPGYESPRHFPPLKDKIIKSNKLLVHFHVYYEDQVPWYIDKLSNINGCDWDLIVTSSNLSEDTAQLIRSFKEDTVFLTTENTGYDVWPFISMLRHVNLDDYELVLKLHTKNHNDVPCALDYVKVVGFQWRDFLVNAILGSKEQFRKCYNLFHDKPDCGIVFERILLRKSRRILPEDASALDVELKRMGIRKNYRFFCAGTIFMARAAAYKRLRDSYLTADCFPAKSESHSGGSLAHVYERILTFLVRDEGYKIYTVTSEPWITFKVKMRLFLNQYLKRIFALEHEPPYDYKVLTLFGKKIVVSKKPRN